MFPDLSPLNAQSKEYWQAMVAGEIRQDFHLGKPVDVRPDQMIFRVDEEADLMLARGGRVRHSLFAGVSGGGKTRLQAGMVVDDLENRRGATAAAGAGDFSDLCIEYTASRYEETGDEYYIENVDVLWPTSRWTANVELYDYDDSQVPADIRDVDFAYWRATQADQHLAVDLRANSSADQDMMLRLKRSTRNAHIAIATPIGAGRRLSPPDIRRILLNPYHNHFDEVLSALQPHLENDVYSHFKKLASLKNRVRDLEHYTESSLNKQSENYSHPAVENLFGRPGEPSFSYMDAVLSNRLVIIRARPTTRFSPHAARKYLDPLLVKLFNACEELTERGERVLHNLYIDELRASGLAEDVEQRLERARGSGLSVKLGVQIIDSMRLGGVDVSAQVLGCCHEVFAFQCKEQETNEYLADYLGKPLRNLQERFAVKDRPDPSKDEIRLNESWSNSHSKTVGKTISVGKTTGQSDGVTIVNAAGVGVGGGKHEAFGNNRSSNWSNSSGSGESQFDGFSEGQTAGSSPIMIDGLISMVPTAGTSVNDSHGHGMSSFQGSSRGGAEGTSHSLGESRSWMQSIMTSLARALVTSNALTHTESKAIANSSSWSHTLSEQLIQRTSEYWEPTGSPRHEFPYQAEVMEVLLSTLSFRHAFLRTSIDGQEKTILFRTPDFPDAFEDRDEARAVVDGYLETLYARKPYMYPAELPETAHERRIKQFLEGAARSELPSAGDQAGEHGNLFDH